MNNGKKFAGMLKSISNNLSWRIKKSALFNSLKSNDIKVNLIFGLGLLLFILVAIDVESDLSVNNEEIDHVIATLLPALDFTDLHLQNAEEFIIICVGIIIHSNDNLIDNYYYSHNEERGPPYI
jgi:hypothetical protein